MNMFADADRSAYYHSPPVNRYVISDKCVVLCAHSSPLNVDTHIATLQYPADNWMHVTVFVIHSIHADLYATHLNFCCCQPKSNALA